MTFESHEGFPGAGALERWPWHDGLERVGVCGVADFDDVRASIVERVSTGKSGGLGFTFTDPITATSIRSTFPWAQSLVVGASAYVPASGSPQRRSDSAQVARFATTNHYTRLRAGLESIAEWLRASGHRAEVLSDDSRLVDRAAAVRAGIGWWGKNTMILAPGIGPWMLLGSVVTDATLPVSVEMARDCGTCDACLPACPTGALVAPGVLDARLCLAAILQQPGVIPRWARSVIADRLYGCDDCLDVCPPGGRLLKSAPSRHGYAIRWILEADDATLGRAFEHFYLARASVDMVRRNALVVAGNSGDGRLADLVAGYTGHPDPILRLHAVWALARLDRPFVAGLINSLAQNETDPRVRDELAAACGQPFPSGK